VVSNVVAIPLPGFHVPLDMSLAFKRQKENKQFMQSKNVQHLTCRLYHSDPVLMAFSPEGFLYETINSASQSV
jgi:hypothetical protein